MREASRRTVDAVRAMEATLRPGMTEIDLWSRFVGGLLAGHGELVSTRLLESGPNTFPYFQECGTRVIQDGDLVCIDTDAVAFESYSADFSRTFLAGDRPATPQQDRKKEVLMGAAWQGWEARTSYWPKLGALGKAGAVPWIAGIALWLAASWTHSWLIAIPAGVWRWL